MGKKSGFIWQMIQNKMAMPEITVAILWEMGMFFQFMIFFLSLSVTHDDVDNTIPIHTKVL